MDDTQEPSLFRQKSSSTMRKGMGEKAVTGNVSSRSGFAAPVGPPVWKMFVDNAGFQKDNAAGIAAEKSRLAASRRSAPKLEIGEGRIRFGDVERDAEELLGDPEWGGAAEESLWKRDLRGEMNRASELALRKQDPSRKRLSESDRAAAEGELGMAEISPERRAELQALVAKDDEYQAEDKELYDTRMRAMKLKQGGVGYWRQIRQGAVDPVERQAEQVRAADARRAEMDSVEQSAIAEEKEILRKMADGVRGNELESLQGRMAELQAAKDQIAMAKGQKLEEVQAARAKAAEEAEKPFFRADDAVSGIWDMVKGLGVTAPAAFYQMIEGLDRPDEYSESAKRAFAEADAYAEEMAVKSEARKRLGEASSFGETARETGQSLGFSAGSMAASLAPRLAAAALGAKTGAATGAAGGAAVGAVGGAGVGAAPGAAVGAAGGGAVGAIGGFLASAPVGMAAGGTAAYRMAGAMFLNEAFNRIREAKGRELTEAEAKEYYEKLLPLAQETALWEAGPEAVGNAISIKGLGKLFGFKALGGKAAAKTLRGKILEKAGGAAAALAGELTTETITEVGQGAAQKKQTAVVEGKSTEGIEADWSAGNVVESLKQVFPSTMMLMATMGTAGGVVKGALTGYDIITGKKQGTEQEAEKARASLEASMTAIDPSAAPPTMEEAVRAALGARPEDGLAGIASMVLIERKLVEMEKPAVERADAAKKMLDEAEAAGDPVAVAVAKVKFLKARDKAVAVPRVRGVLKITRGRDLSALTDSEARSLGITRDGKPMKGEELESVGLTKPLVSFDTADGSPVVLDEALAMVERVMPEARAEIKMDEAGARLKAGERAARGNAGAGQKFRVTGTGGTVIEVEAADEAKAEMAAMSDPAWTGGEVVDSVLNVTPATVEAQTPSVASVATETPASLPEGEAGAVPGNPQPIIPNEQNPQGQAGSQSQAQAPLPMREMPTGTATPSGQTGGRPATAAPQAAPAVTPEAEALIASVDAGGVPMSVSPSLERIAAEHGIPVTGATKPLEIVEALRALRDTTSTSAAPTATPTDSLPAGPSPTPGGVGGLVVSRDRFSQEDESTDAKVHRAIMSSEGADQRWEEIRQKGATDAELKKIIGREFGERAGSSLHGGFDVWGGSDPRIMTHGDKKVIKGKELVNFVRNLIGVPFVSQNTPSGAQQTPSINKPAQQAPTRIKKAIAKAKKELGDALNVTKDPSVRIVALEDGTVHANIEALEAEAAKIGMDEAAASRWIAAAIDEEVRHAAQHRAARAQWEALGGFGVYEEWRNKHYGAIWRNEFVDGGKAEMVQALYGNKLNKLDDWQKAFEGLRIIQQKMATGSPTEVAALWASLKAETIAHIRAALKALKKMLKGELSPTLKAEIAAIEKQLITYDRNNKPRARNPKDRIQKPSSGKKSDGNRKLPEGDGSREAANDGGTDAAPSDGAGSSPLIGQKVTYVRDGVENVGEVKLVAANGDLLVWADGKQLRVLAGEVVSKPLAGEQINKEWTAFSAESGTLGIPRALMPQIKAGDRSALVQFLKARGVNYADESVPATTLKPTQTEYSPEKVEKAKKFEGGNRSILVSSDNHVLDGHHQWMAAIENGENIDIIRLDSPIRTLLPLVLEMPSAKSTSGEILEAPKPSPRDRNQFPGEDYAVPPNVVYIQPRGLDTEPMADQVFTYEYDGTPADAAEVGARAFVALQTQFPDMSQRESIFGASGADGMTVFRLKMDQVNDKVTVLGKDGKKLPNASTNQDKKEEPAKKPRKRAIRFNNRVMEVFRQNPVIDFIMEYGGLMSPSSAKKAGFKASEYEDAPSFRNPTFNSIYNANGGETAENMTQALYESGLLRESSIPLMWAEISKAAQSATRQNQQIRQEIEKQGENQKKLEAFEAANQEKLEGVMGFQAGDMAEGDTVTIGGEVFTAESNDGSVVVLKDGEKFGTQRVPAENVLWAEIDDSSMFDEADMPEVVQGIVDEVEAQGYESTDEFVAENPTEIEGLAEAQGLASDPQGVADTVPDRRSPPQAPQGQVKRPTSKMDVKNSNSRELFADDGGFSLVADTTVDGDAVAAERKAKEEAKAAQDAAQGDMFGGNAAPTLSEADQALIDVMKDLVDGLEAADIVESFTRPIPPDKIVALIGVAQKYIAEGVNTPEAFAQRLSSIANGKLVPFSQSLWGAFIMVDPTVNASPNWSGIYADNSSRNSSTINDTTTNDNSSGTSLESDRQDADAQDGSGQGGVQFGRKPTRGNGKRVVQGGKQGRNSGGNRVESDNNSPASERVGSDQQPSGETSESPTSTSPAENADGSRVPDERGVEAYGRGEDDTHDGLILAGTASESMAQGSAESRRDVVSVKKSAPSLKVEQAEDVVFVENRLYTKGEPGVLLTNGTGTGKTFSGLGVVKRALDRGDKHIIIVAPSDKVVNDWIKTAKTFFGISDIYQLADKKDNGTGNRVVVTTYANFGDNMELVKRPWSLVVTDEAHYLSQSKDGNATLAQRNFKALTWHYKDGVRNRVTMEMAEEYAEISEISKTIDSNNRIANSDDTMDQVRLAIQEENVKLNQRLSDLRLKIDTRRLELEAQMKAMEKKDRPKAVFLSATPFAYHFSLDYAEGYLFEHGEEPTSNRYNTPSARSRFFMENFGYRMLYNKLTQPENAAATGILERMFSEKLKRDGAMRGRMLSVPFDYSRDFVLAESMIGTKIDEIFDLIMREDAYRPLRDTMEIGDYLARRYLLEGLKAVEAIKRVREHLSLGRKVVVFHDYKKGGSTNPLRMASSNPEAMKAYEDLQAAVPGFDRLVSMLDGLRSPIDAFQSAFPDVGIFNGNVPKTQRRKIIDQFNTSGSGLDVLLAQRASAKEGISMHDTDGRHQRVFIDLGIPGRPTDAIQSEGRIIRLGMQSNGVIEYLTTGTNFERWTFAQTIAQRASTAENLAMGENARALLQAFSTGYNDAAPIKPSANQGVGGKKADSARESGDPFENAVALYFTNQKKTSKNKAEEGVDYFATPEPLGFKMVEWAGIRPGERVLEPSGGHGAIARFFPDSTTRHAVEPSYELAGRLALNAPDTVLHQMPFEDFNIINKFDAIVMNPPFGTAGKKAMEHLEKATRHLKDGGRVVALIPMGSSMEKRFDKWYEDVDGMYMVADIRLPSVTFERAGTSVSSRVVILDKTSVENAPQQVFRDFSNATSVREFFDRIKESGVPDRPAPAVEKTPAQMMADLLNSGRDAKITETKEPVANASDFSPMEFIHTQKGTSVFVATINRKLDAAEYQMAKASAKKHGGYYSSYNKGGAIPGFHFPDAESRDAFLGSGTALEASPLQYERYTYRREALRGEVRHVVSTYNDRTGRPEERVFDTYAEAKAEMDKIDDLSKPATAEDFAAFLNGTLEAADIGGLSSADLTEENLAARLRQMGTQAEREKIRAQQEEFGQVTGRPDLANPGASPATRQAFDEEDEVRKFYGTRETRTQWKKAGEALADPEKETETVKQWLAAALQADKAAESGGLDLDMPQLSPESVVAIRIIMERRAQQAGGDPKKLAAVSILRNAYRSARANVARVMAAGVDAFKNPEQRHREQLVNLITDLSEKDMKQIEARHGNNQKAKEAAIEAAVIEKAKKVEAALSKLGITIEEITSGQAFLSLSQNKVIKDITDRMDQAERLAVLKMQQGAGFDAIRRATGLPDSKIEAIRAKLYKDLKDKLHAKVAAGLKLEDLKDKMRGGLEAADLNALTPEEVEAELDRIIAVGFGIPKTLNKKSGIARAKTKKKIVDDEASAMAAGERVAKRWLDRLEGKTKKRPARPSAEMDKLIRAHIAKPLPDFIARATALGATVEQAAALDAEISTERDRKQLKKANPGQAKKALAPANPAEVDWNRPEFTDGLESYAFDTTERTDIMERVVEIRMVVGAAGQAKLLTGKDRQKADRLMAEINSILAKHGTSVTKLASGTTTSENYRFDIRDRQHVAIVARTIAAINADGIDKMQEYYYSSLLSGLQTMIVNATGVINSAWQATVERGFEGAINTVFQSPDNADLREVKYLARAMGPAFARAWSNAVSTWNTEIPFFEEDILNRPPDFQRIAEGVSGYRPGSIGGTKGRIIRTPSRILMATDEFLNTTRASIEVGAMAFRLAKKRGLKEGSPEFDKFIRMEVNTPGSIAWQMAAEKALKGSFNNPLPGQKSTVREKGGKNVVRTQTAMDFVGFGLHAVQNMLISTPKDSATEKLIKTLTRMFFLPFVRVPFNIIQQGVERSINPISILDMGLLLGANVRFKDGKFTMNADGGRERIVEYASRQIQGMGILLMLAALGEGDDDDLDKPILITGSRPYKETRKGERELGYRMGLGPYVISVKLPNGKRVSVGYGRVEPAATVLGGTVDTLKAFKNRAAGKETTGEATGQALMAYASQVNEKTSLRGAADMLAIFSGEAPVDRFAVDRMAVIVPNLLRQGLRESDPYFRERPSEFKEMLAAAMVPYGQQPAKVDIYGEEQKKPGKTVPGRVLDPTDSAAFGNSRTVDKMLYNWIRQNPLNREFPIPSEIGKTYTDPITGERGVRMTTAQHAKLKKVAGDRIRVLTERERFNADKPTENDMKRLKQIVDESRQAARNILTRQETWRNLK